MVKAEEDTTFNLHKKKGIAAEKKEAKLEKDEAEKYQRLKDQLVKISCYLLPYIIFFLQKTFFQTEKQMQLHLFQLYHNEREIKVLNGELNAKQADLDKVTEKREGIDEELKEKKKEQGKLNRDLNKIEQQIHELVT